MSFSKSTAHKNSTSFPSTSFPSSSSHSHSHSPLDYTSAQKPSQASIVRDDNGISFLCYGPLPPKINPKTGEEYQPSFKCQVPHRGPMNLATIEELADHRGDTLMMCPEECKTVLMGHDFPSRVTHIMTIHPDLADKFAGVSLQSIKDSMEAPEGLSAEEAELAINTAANKKFFGILIKVKLFHTPNGWSLETPRNSASNHVQYTVVRETSIPLTPRNPLPPRPTIPVPIPPSLASNPDYVAPTNKWKAIPPVNHATISTRGSKRHSPSQRGGKFQPPSRRSNTFANLPIDEEDDELSMETLQQALDIDVPKSSKKQADISKTVELISPPNGITLEKMCAIENCDGTTVTNIAGTTVANIAGTLFTCGYNHNLTGTIKPNVPVPSEYCQDDRFWGPKDLQSNCSNTACTKDHKTGRNAFISGKKNTARKAIAAAIVQRTLPKSPHSGLITPPSASPPSSPPPLLRRSISMEERPLKRRLLYEDQPPLRQDSVEALSLQSLSICDQTDDGSYFEDTEEMDHADDEDYDWKKMDDKCANAEA